MYLEKRFLNCIPKTHSKYFAKNYEIEVKDQRNINLFYV